MIEFSSQVRTSESARSTAAKSSASAAPIRPWSMRPTMRRTTRGLTGERVNSGGCPCAPAATSHGRATL